MTEEKRPLNRVRPKAARRQAVKILSKDQCFNLPQESRLSIRYTIPDGGSVVGTLVALILLTNEMDLKGRIF